MRNKIFTINNNGSIKDFNVILTFKNETNNNYYVCYTDNSYDEMGKLRIYAAVYDPDTNSYIRGIVDKDEWKEIFNVLDNVLLKKD